LDGRRRAGRSKVQNPELGSGTVVDVQREAGLLGVKGECTVDVSDRQRDDLQGEHAQASFLVRKFRIAAAISLAWVSSAKWPVSRNRTSAFRLSRLNASAPDGRKNGSCLPQTASSGGWCLRKYSWNFGYSATLLALSRSRSNWISSLPGRAGSAESSV